MRNNTLKITAAGLFAAMITIMTAYICHIPYGANGGYIHFGDALIYLGAVFLPRPYALAAVPYSSIVDSTIVIKESELKDAYNKKKEQFRQYVETRNIKYIDVQVTASPEDKADIQKEVEEYTVQLAENPSDYSNFIRSTVLVP